MEKQNGFKMFERGMVLRSRLTNRDLQELGTTKEKADRLNAMWRKNDLSIIPNPDEGKKSK